MKPAASALSDEPSSRGQRFAGDEAAWRPSPDTKRDSGRSAAPGASGNANIRVVCRFRPPVRPAAGYDSGPKCLAIQEDGQTIVVDTSDSGTQKSIRFTFDKVFNGPDATQAQVYEYSARPSIDDVLEGYNATIFAYGQTGAGKTHTMIGTRSDPGIIPRCIQQLFSKIVARGKDVQFAVRASFVEVYNEVIRDLLNPSGNNLKIHESPGVGSWIDDVTEVPLTSEKDVFELLDIGNVNRAVAAHGMNDQSSRSHSIFMLSLSSKTVDGVIRTGMLNLCDLAGSEKIKKTRASGSVLTEAKNINKSLHALGSCINALSKDKGHVPFRDSKLTRILQESLGGNCKTTVIIACSPASTEVAETVSACRFGQRAKQITGKATKNVRAQPSDVRAMKRELENLHAALAQLEQENVALRSALPLEESRATFQNEQAAALAKMEQIRAELQSTKGSLVTVEQQANISQEAANKKLEDTLASLEVAESQLRVAQETAKRNETDMMQAQVEHHQKTVAMFEDRLHSLREMYAEKLQQFQSITVQAVQESLLVRYGQDAQSLANERSDDSQTTFASEKGVHGNPMAEPETNTDLKSDAVNQGIIKIQSAFRGMKGRNSAKTLNAAEIQKGNAAAILLDGQSQYSNLGADETLRRATVSQLKRRTTQIEELEHELVKREDVVAGLKTYLCSLGHKLNEVVSDATHTEKTKAIASLREELRRLVCGITSVDSATERLSHFENGVNFLLHLQKPTITTGSGKVLPTSPGDVSVDPPTVKSDAEGLVFSFFDFAEHKLQALEHDMATEKQNLKASEYKDAAYDGVTTSIDSSAVVEPEDGRTVASGGIPDMNLKVADSERQLLHAFDRERHTVANEDSLPAGFVSLMSTGETNMSTDFINTDAVVSRVAELISTQKMPEDTIPPQAIDTDLGCRFEPSGVAIGNLYQDLTSESQHSMARRSGQVDVANQPQVNRRHTGERTTPTILNKLWDEKDASRAIKIQSAFRGMKGRNSAKTLNAAEIQKGKAATILLGSQSQYSNLGADETLRRATVSQLKRRTHQVDQLEAELGSISMERAKAQNEMDMLRTDLNTKDALHSAAHKELQTRNSHIEQLERELESMHAKEAKKQSDLQAALHEKETLVREQIQIELQAEAARIELAKSLSKEHSDRNANRDPRLTKSEVFVQLGETINRGPPARLCGGARAIHADISDVTKMVAADWSKEADASRAIKIQSAFRGMKGRNSAKTLNAAEIQKGKAATILLGSQSQYSNLGADETLRRATVSQLKRRTHQVDQLEAELGSISMERAKAQNEMDMLRTDLNTKDALHSAAHKELQTRNSHIEQLERELESMHAKEAKKQSDLQAVLCIGKSVADVARFDSPSLVGRATEKQEVQEDTESPDAGLAAAVFMGQESAYSSLDADEMMRRATLSHLKSRNEQVDILELQLADLVAAQQKQTNEFRRLLADKTRALAVQEAVITELRMKPTTAELLQSTAKAPLTMNSEAASAGLTADSVLISHTQSSSHWSRSRSNATTENRKSTHVRSKIEGGDKAVALSRSHDIPPEQFAEGSCWNMPSVQLKRSPGLLSLGTVAYHSKSPPASIEKEILQPWHFRSVQSSVDAVRAQVHAYYVKSKRRSASTRFAALQAVYQHSRAAKSLDLDSQTNFTVGLRHAFGDYTANVERSADSKYAALQRVYQQPVRMELLKCSAGLTRDRAAPSSHTATQKTSGIADSPAKLVEYQTSTPEEKGGSTVSSHAEVVVSTSPKPNACAFVEAQASHVTVAAKMETNQPHTNVSDRVKKYQTLVGLYRGHNSLRASVAPHLRMKAAMMRYVQASNSQTSTASEKYMALAGLYNVSCRCKQGANAWPETDEKHVEMTPRHATLKTAKTHSRPEQVSLVRRGTAISEVRREIAELHCRVALQSEIAELHSNHKRQAQLLQIAIRKATAERDLAVEQREALRLQTQRKNVDAQFENCATDSPPTNAARTVQAHNLLVTHSEGDNSIAQDTNAVQLKAKFELMQRTIRVRLQSLFSSTSIADIDQGLEEAAVSGGTMEIEANALKNRRAELINVAVQQMDSCSNGENLQGMKIMLIKYKDYPDAVDCARDLLKARYDQLIGSAHKHMEKLCMSEDVASCNRALHDFQQFDELQTAHRLLKAHRDSIVEELELDAFLGGIENDGNLIVVKTRLQSLCSSTSICDIDTALKDSEQFGEAVSAQADVLAEHRARLVVSMRTKLRALCGSQSLSEIGSALHEAAEYGDAVLTQTATLRRHLSHLGLMTAQKLNNLACSKNLVEMRQALRGNDMQAPFTPVEVKTATEALQIRYSQLIGSSRQDLENLCYSDDLTACNKALDDFQQFNELQEEHKALKVHRDCLVEQLELDAFLGGIDDEFQRAPENDSAITSLLMRFRTPLFSAAINEDGASGSDVNDMLQAADKRNRLKLEPREMLRLKEQMKLMSTTIDKVHTVEGVGDWDGSLAMAEHQLQEAAEQVLCSNDGAAEAIAAQEEFDGWSALIISHPDYQERELRAAQAWDAEHLEDCTAALSELREIVPSNICELDRNELVDAIGSAVLGRRLWEKRILCFLFMPTSAIAQLHFADLDSKYWPFGLDLREMQAVYAVLTAVRWRNDVDGRKTQWRKAYREKLAELTAKARAIQNSGSSEMSTFPAWIRHPAYTALRAPQTFAGTTLAKTTGIGAGKIESKIEQKKTGIALRQLLLEDGVAQRKTPFTLARFGALEYKSVSDPVVLCNPILADSTLRSPFEVINKWVVVQRGTCSFVAKARRVQEARGCGMIVVDTDDEITTLAGDGGMDDDITIPIVCISASDGADLLTPDASKTLAVSLEFQWDEADSESDSESASEHYVNLESEPEGAQDVFGAKEDRVALMQNRRYCKTCKLVFDIGPNCNWPCSNNHANFVYTKHIPEGYGLRAGLAMPQPETQKGEAEQQCIAATKIQAAARALRVRQRYSYVFKERKATMDKLRELQSEQTGLLQAERCGDQAARVNQAAAQLAALRAEIEQANDTRQLYTRKWRHRAKKIRRKIEAIEFEITRSESSSDDLDTASVIECLNQQRDALVAEATEVDQRLLRSQRLSEHDFFRYQEQIHKVMASADGAVQLDLPIGVDQPAVMIHDFSPSHTTTADETASLQSYSPFLSALSGERVHIRSQNDQNWWYAIAESGETGWIPASHVKILAEPASMDGSPLWPLAALETEMYYSDVEHKTGKRIASDVVPNDADGSIDDGDRPIGASIGCTTEREACTIQ